MVATVLSHFELYSYKDDTFEITYDALEVIIC